ncbi:MAG: polyribonucleotide nucleotidyltransferase [Acidobacteria bacterium 13_1_20CM_2_55_15]|nr:MAG: polyribonucleotide nucleotidyltransferase [Acidobacteria bacterium 13_1_40CM_56_16]OLD22736.1 MAG: polyribonucleotide nucleotidyltransferase [Acidobacteria bacterium 13_1_40CM_3_56_11]OLE88125.1 MAG: polyribonucleotide nucleotidyltransferase [Acidobacteria bacterium 13_1_20CM_2_55_15]
MNVHKVSRTIGERELSIEIGKLAKQAHGSALVRYGETVVLVTACADKEPREGLDFFPLTVDYRENFYAAGKIPGGFFKREGKPSEREVLNSRLIDRPIRPLFPEGYQNETQVIALVLSADPDIDPSMHAIIGASAALYTSTIPFAHPIAAVRVGLIDGRYYLNPTYTELKNSRLNLAVAGMEDGIAMVECGANEVSEEIMVEALNFAHQAIRQIIELQKQLYDKIRPEKLAVEAPKIDAAVSKKIEKEIRASLEDALDTHKYSKLESYALVDAAKEKAVELFPEAAEDEEKLVMIKRVFGALKERIFRDQILYKRERPDKRDFKTIRPIWIETSVLPRTHGSAVFTRGETQALVTATLGTADDVQRMDRLEGESYKRFIMHYNFPPFSVGEVSPLRGPGRREIGHGALAERALLPMIPSEEAWPYTIRVVSDILESNGSSSMATVCGGTLALMDAGVPIKAPVAGVAMGLVKEGDTYAVLTDIAGAEDHYGDMDFKVAGTRDGITALQMDIKIPGVTAHIMSEALAQAKEGRLFILDKMLEAIAEVRTEISPYAPRIYSMKIPTDKIRDVIGPGGKMIRSIIEQTGVKIDVSDDGRVNIASSDGPSANKAIEIISNLTATPEIGKTYRGKVVRIADFGAFVELFPGTDGLLHISEIDENRIRNVRDVLQEGDQVMVKVVGLEGNKIKLSRKAVLREQRQKQEQKQ